MKFKNLSGGMLRVSKRTESGYESVLVEPGAVIELNKDELNETKKSYVTDIFAKGFLVEAEAPKEEGVTLEGLEEIAKLPPKEFKERVNQIQSVQALKELLNMSLSKIKQNIVNKRLKELPHAEDAGGVV